MKQSLLILGVLLASWMTGICQLPLNQVKITSSHTSFPDTGRSHGHLYKNVVYNATDHYSDSSVIIITLDNFKAIRQGKR